MDFTLVFGMLLVCTGLSQADVDLKIEENSFKISSPQEYTFMLLEPTSVTFGMKLLNSAESDDKNVIDLTLFLSDKDTFDDTEKKVKVADKDEGLSEIQFPIKVPKKDGDNDGEVTVSGAVASITVPGLENCQEFKHLCAQLNPDNDLQCIDITNKVDCSLITIKADSFSITGPDDYTLKKTEATTLTFGLTFSNAGTATKVTDVQLYVSDNADFSKTEKEVKVADREKGISDIDFNTEVPAEAGGKAGERAISDAKGSVTLPSTNCDDFSLLCALVKPHNDVKCVDISEKTDCTDSVTTAEATTADSGTGTSSVNIVAMAISTCMVLVMLIK